MDRNASHTLTLAGPTPVPGAGRRGRCACVGAAPSGCRPCWRSGSRGRPWRTPSSRRSRARTSCRSPARRTGPAPRPGSALGCCAPLPLPFTKSLLDGRQVTGLPSTYRTASSLLDDRQGALVSSTYRTAGKRNEVMLMTTRPMIEAKGLVKSYGAVHALVGLDFSVEKGSILALLGPNGAGKTTVGAHTDHPGGGGRRVGPDRRLRRAQPGHAGAPAHRGHRPGRDAGRAPDGLPKPGDGGRAVRPQAVGGHPASE